MGAELVEGSDLRVVEGRIAMRTTRGYQPIDVLYRRVDDEYLDPLSFNPDSVLGRLGHHGCLPGRRHHHRQCAGHRHLRRQGDLQLHAEIVEFYTGEKPILQNVPTWRCSEPDALKYVLDNLKSWSSRKYTARAATAC